MTGHFCQIVLPFLLEQRDVPVEDTAKLVELALFSLKGTHHAPQQGIYLLQSVDKILQCVNIMVKNTPVLLMHSSPENVLGWKLGQLSRRVEQTHRHPPSTWGEQDILMMLT